MKDRDLLERIINLEKENLSERIDYLYSQWEEATSSIKIADDRKKELDYKLKLHAENINKKIDELSNQFKVIQPFVGYMLNYFNPDNKLKKEIDRLTEELEAKDNEYKKLRKKLEEIIK